MRNLIALAFLIELTAAAAAQGCGPTNPNCVVPTAPALTNNNQAASTAFVHNASGANATVLYATNFSGATVGDQISACVAALPSTGGICDARGLASGGTIPTITLAKSGVNLLLPCGVFNVTGPIIVWNNGGSISGFNMLGCGTSFDFAVGTQLNWAGGATGPLLDLRAVRDSTFSNFSIKSDLTAPLAEGIRRETWPGGVSTNVEFTNIIIYSVRATGLIKGVRWCTGFDCSNGVVVGNNDLDTLTGVVVSNYDNCAFSIEGAQSKTHTFYNSAFSGQSQSQRGVCTTQGADPSTNAGSFRWYGGGGGGSNQTADFDLGATTDDIVINGFNFEGSKRLLQTATAASQLWPISIGPGRWTSNNINADGKAILYKARGPLNVTGLMIEVGASVVPPTFSIESSGGPVAGIAIGNAVQSSGAVATTDPFICASAQGACWNKLGNMVNDPGSGNNFLIPNSIVPNTVNTTTALNTQTGSTYTVTLDDTSIIANASGTMTVTLLAAATYPGRIINVKTIANQTVVSASSNVVPLAGGAAGTAILSGTAGKWASLQSDGTNWVITAGN
ncbi:MAG TPA: hypothetical protein VNH83_14930 [Bryobacteraceae bacterium]|nr:hypothetical protein [Bryobacteraceae bacterium]